MSIKIKVITPEKIIWETEAEQIVLPSVTGGLGILTNHANLVTVLKAGLIKKFEQNSCVPLILWGGVAQIEDNQITVLANGVEEFTEDTMTREAANQEVLKFTQELEKMQSDEADYLPTKLKVELAEARVEGLALIGSA
jgi:F-type H+-transporting ATPase subunit epsilon